MPLLPSMKTPFRPSRPTKPPRNYRTDLRRPSFTPPQQARRDVMGVVQPVIADITRSINARTRAGMGAIGGYSQQLAQALLPQQENLGGIYDAAQARQAQVDAALTGGLRSGANTDAELLAQKLQVLGPAAAAERADQVRQAGLGAAGALQGTGSASLSQLIAEGAAARAYGAKLPDVARLGGLQSARDLQLSQARDLADRIGEIRAKVPEMVLGRVDQFAKNRADREAARFENMLARKAFGLDVAKARQGAANDQARLDLATQKEQTAATQGDQRLALSKARYVSDLRYKNRKLKIEETKLKIDAKLEKRNATRKGVSPTSYATSKRQAGEKILAALAEAESAGVSKPDYQKMLSTAMRVYGLTLVDAQGILDLNYQPGEAGRPYLTFQQRQALVARGVPERVASAAMWVGPRGDAARAEIFRLLGPSRGIMPDAGGR